jgi:hypothetical protein
MIAMCTKTIHVSVGGIGVYDKTETFTNNEIYECIRSMRGGTVVVKKENRQIKVDSQTFDTHFTSIEEIRDEKLNALLTS